jgi:hypothetical protein
MSFSIPSLKSFISPVTISAGYGVSPSLLMLHGETVVDSSANNWTLTNTNVTASSVQKKFGTNSLSFNGTSSNLLLPNNAAFSLSTYTIEAWIYINSLSADMGFYSSSTVGNIVCTIKNTGAVNLSNNIGYSTSSATTPITAGSWFHLAIVQNAGVTVYVDGNSILSVTSTNMNYGYIGSIASATYFNGYMDEFRISNSAIYTSNFTRPTAAFA